MKLRSLFILALIVLIPAMAQADGRAKIWFGIDGAEYVGKNSDPWLTESWLTFDSNFNLDVENTHKEDTIFDTHLVLAIPSTLAPSDLWSVKINDTIFHYADFSNSGDHTYLERHGVFGGDNGALWTEYTIGNIEAQQKVSLPVLVSGSAPDGFLLHFDAYGSSLPGSQNGYYFAPYSHDANHNINPEPVSSALFLIGLAGLAGRRLIRRK